jgi:cytochrome c biogenesis protein CcdA
MEDFSQYLTVISPLTYLVVFIAGLATSFTPCVYPLIPLVIGVIGSGKEKSRGKSFLMSCAYVFGIAITFSILGVVSVLTGRIFGQLQSHPVTHIAVGIIIILFALTLLDVITLPAFLLNKIRAGRIVKTSSPFSIFLLGVTSGFITAPCTLAVLGAVLAYVATTRNLVVGFSLLFTFALGFGTILILVGTFAGILAGLPRLKKGMGVIQKVLAFGLIVLGGHFIFNAVLSLL